MGYHKVWRHRSIALTGSIASRGSIATAQTGKATAELAALGRFQGWSWLLLGCWECGGKQPEACACGRGVGS